MLFCELEKNVKYLTKHELLNAFCEGYDENGDMIYSKSYLFRSMIMSEKDYPTNDGETRTLRGIWYKVVKPVLDKLNLIPEDITEKEMKNWTNLLSSSVGVLFRAGELTYRDLSISDISRMKATPSIPYYTTGGNSYRYQGGVAPYPNIIVGIEKDSTYAVISSIARLLGLSCISSKGMGSLGAIESLVRSMLASDVEFSIIHILAINDYDPAGYNIANAIKIQVEDVLKALGRSDIDVEFTRVGLTPDQLSDEDIEANKYTPAKKGLDTWMEMTDGINGERKGLELDSLTNKEIRSLFVDAIEPYIDTDLYESFVKKSYIKYRFFQSMKDKIDEMFDEVYEEFEPLVETVDIELFRKAKEGYSALHIPNLCENDFDEDIEEMVMNYFG